VSTSSELDVNERLNELFRIERKPLLRVAFLLLGSREAAEDVVQDAFASVGRRLDSIENPMAYLRTTVVNGARRWHRQRERDHRKQARRGLDDVVVDTSWSADAIAVRAALSELPFDQREAIVLRYFADLSFREIGELLDCPTQTVATRVRRGLDRVRHALEDPT
jgi:RNA polymerase sigma factor (sigma-70 family)